MRSRKGIHGGMTCWSPILPSASSIEIGGSPGRHSFLGDPRISRPIEKIIHLRGQEGARSPHGGIHAGAAKVITYIAKYPFGKG